MTIKATYHGEVRVVRSSYTSKTGPTITLALHDIDELNKVQGMDGRRYMLALVEIGDDEQPVQAKQEAKGGALSVLAAQWCKQREFQMWIRPIYDRFMGGDGSGWGDIHPDEFLPATTKHIDKFELHAAHCVKVFCGCEQSRREIDIDPVKTERFQSEIRGPYMKYLAMNGGVRFSCPEEVPA